MNKLLGDKIQEMINGYFDYMLSEIQDIRAVGELSKEQTRALTNITFAFEEFEDNLTEFLNYELSIISGIEAMTGELKMIGQTLRHKK